VGVKMRVVLTVLVAVAGLTVGVAFGPRLARLGAGPGVSRAPGSLGAGRSRAAQPDWGGGRLSFSPGTTGGVLDSVKKAAEAAGTEARTYSTPAGGVALQEKPDGDHALTLALPCPSQPGRCGVFGLPSTGHFRKELLPGAGDAEPPASDIPLYPRSVCRTQVGRGTACFVGFYLTSDSVEAVRSYYVRTLGRFGWRRVTAGSPGLLETFAKSNEDRMALVQLKRQDSVTTRIGIVAMTSRSPDQRERK
jgi:hypothetical protein